MDIRGALKCSTEAPAGRPTSEPEPTGDAGGIIPSLGGDGGRAKVEFFSVSARCSRTCGVRRDGSVECWGNNHVGQATPPAGEFASVSAGASHSCGVRRDGPVECWGSDHRFQVILRPVGQATPPEGEFASVSAGTNHTCGVRTDGTVARWGSDENNFGQATPPGNFASSISIEAGAVCVVNGGARTCWDRSYDPK